MTPNVKDWVKGLVSEIAKAPSACPEMKTACESWLSKCDTDAMNNETKKLFETLKCSVMPLEQTIKFFGTDAAKKRFGEATAAEKKKHAEERLAKGETYCDCPACAPGMVLIMHEEYVMK